MWETWAGGGVSPATAACVSPRAKAVSLTSFAIGGGGVSGALAICVRWSVLRPLDFMVLLVSGRRAGALTRDQSARSKWYSTVSLMSWSSRVVGLRVYPRLS